MKKITLSDFERNHFKSKKSWRYCLALFGLLFMGISSFAQTIQLGSGATTNSYLPINYLWEKSYTQTIYTGGELTNAGATITGGTITKIRFKPTASVSTETWRTWTIYMDNTAKVGFSSTSDWIPSGDLTQVFSGNLPDNTIANAWIEIILDTPFAWDGSNVAVAITEFTPDYSFDSPNWASYTLAPSSGSKALYKYQDGDDISITNPPLGELTNVVAQIQFDGSLQEICAGTPSGGTASLTPNVGNSGSSFTASATGVTGASGLTFQWQKSINGTWQDIAGATSITSTITSETGVIGDATDYRLKVTCGASALIGYSTTTTFTIALTYCTPTGSGNNGDEIVNFTLNNLNNTSAPSEGIAGYKDYSSLVAPAQLELNVPYIASLKGGAGSGNHGMAIWIDYNKNGTFETSEKVSHYTGITPDFPTANTVVSLPEFTVPTGTALGIYRLRVQYHYSKAGDLLDPCTATSTYSETEDYSVQVFPAPTCIQPSGLMASGITSSSADLSWTSAGTSFEIEWGVKGFTQGLPEGNPIITTTSTSHTLNSGLASDTLYSYYVRQNCGSENGLSLWTGPFTFRTACAPTTAFEENFDSYTLTGATNPLPSCWSRLGNTGSSYITTGSGAPMSGTKRLLLSASATGPTIAFAVMPQVSNLNAGTHRLKFKAYSSQVGRVLEIGYFDSPDDPTSFNSIEAFSMPSTTLSTTEEFSYIPPAFIPAGVQTLAFMVNDNNLTGTTIVYVDDVKWEPIPPCGDILASNIIFSNPQINSIDVEWTTENSENAWQYVYTSDATVTDPNTITEIGQVNLNPLTTITDLQPNTTYKYWMRSNCGSGSVGIWSDVKTFTTACAPVTVFPYTIDFEGVTTPAIPSCTSIQNAGTGNNWLTSSVTSYGFSSKVLQYTYNVGNAANAWFYTNEMILEAGVTYKLSYKYGNNYISPTSYVEKLKVFYGTSALDTDMVNELSDHTSVNNPVAQDNSVFFTPTVSGSYVIGFNAYSEANQYYLYVDNIVVDLAPTTLPVCATNIVATTNATCGNYATTLTWDAVASTNGYNVVIAATNGGTPETFEAGNSTTFSFVGTYNTDYTYTVIPFNNIGSAVGCVPQTFTTAPNGCYCPSVPTNNNGAGISNVQIGNQDFPNGDVMYFDHTATPVDLAQGIVANLKVKLATGISYGTNVWIDLNDNYTFETDEELFFSAETPTTIPNPFIQDASFVMPLDAPLGQHRMRIVSTDVVQNPANPCYSGTWGVTLDFMVNITPAPSCLAPSDASATNITTTSATLNWTASTSAPANGYDYYVTTSTTPPTAATVPTGTVAAGVTTAEASALPPSSVHKFYIRSVCSASDSSAWTQAGTFSTLCDAAPLPYTIDFESVTVPNLPLCTVNQNVGTGNDWKTFSGTNSGFTGKYLRYTYNSDNAANTWFFTNVFNLVAGTSYTVSYKYGAAGFSERLKVAYGNEANAAAMTTILADHANITGSIPQNNSESFTPTTSGLYVIGFNAYSNLDEFYLMVDDIVIMVTPTCVPPAVAPTVTNITANTATLNWIASTTAAASGYDYYYSTSNTNPTASTEVLGSVDAGITTAELTSLSPITTYYVWVRSKCSSTDVSAWSYSATFTTLCSSYATPFTEAFTTFLPSCWSRASAGTIATGPTNAVAGIWFADGFLNVGTTGAAKVNLYSTNRIGWLITPTLNTTVGESYAFTFDYGVTAYGATTQSAMGSDDSVKIAMSTDNGTTWTEIQNFTNASNITNTSQQFAHTFVATSTAVKFAFVATDGTVDDSQDYEFFVDNVAMDLSLSNVEFNNNTFTAYPNPVKNNLTIRYNENITDVIVYNLMGQQLFVKNINATEGQIDMSNLATGTYLVKVTSGDKVQTMKVIKE